MTSPREKRPSSSSTEPEVHFSWDDKAVKQTWERFVKFGTAQNTELTLKNFDKWLKDAGVLDQKTVSTTMTGIAFSKVSGPKRKTLNYKETKKVIINVAQDKASKSNEAIQTELDSICQKLAALEGPSLGGTTKAVSKGVVDRLTDVSKYTGSHKERFDPATGRGKGKQGREDISEKSGYVSGYKNKDSYDKIHGKAA